MLAVRMTFAVRAAELLAVERLGSLLPNDGAFSLPNGKALCCRTA
jgi:hypothetical protein